VIVGVVEDFSVKPLNDTAMFSIQLYTAISIKVVPEQSGKVEYERERLLGNAKKLMNFLAIPSSLSGSYQLFRFAPGQP
jgi:hypothetical protein